MSDEKESPKLVRRRENRRSTVKSGRTIAGHREKMEKASERIAAHEKMRKKQNFRLIATSVSFLLIIAIVIGIVTTLSKGEPEDNPEAEIAVTYKPTIEIVDEDAISGGIVTERMKDYIGQAEFDFRAVGLTPVKAVIPSGAIREIDFYLDGVPGFIKTTIDRGTAVSIEDAKRMLKYLEEKEITEFIYIDVRIEGKAYWK